MPARRRGAGDTSPQTSRRSGDGSKTKQGKAFSWSLYIGLCAAVFVVAGLYMAISRVRSKPASETATPGVPRRRFVDLPDEPSPRRGLVGGDAEEELSEPAAKGATERNAGAMPPAEPKSKPFVSDGMKRTIVLGSGGGLWNTGVWTGWGYGKDVTLNWAAAGVQVRTILHSQASMYRRRMLFCRYTRLAATNVISYATRKHWRTRTRGWPRL